MSKSTTEARDALFKALNGGGAAWRFHSTTAALVEWALENLTAAGYAIVPASPARASLEAQARHEHARAEEALAKKRGLHKHVEIQAARARAAEAQTATLLEALEKALWRDDGVWTRTCSACGYHDAPNSDGHTHENINPWCWTHPLHRLLSGLSTPAAEHDVQVGTAAILADRVLNYPEVRREAVEAFEATLGDPCASCHCPRGYHVSESHPAYLADGSECYCEKWLALKETE